MVVSVVLLTISIGPAVIVLIYMFNYFYISWPVTFGTYYSYLLSIIRMAFNYIVFSFAAISYYCLTATIIFITAISANIKIVLQIRFWLVNYYFIGTV
ncbi:hypothetical protein D3C73_1185630 [compost metagenome]